MTGKHNVLFILVSLFVIGALLTGCQPKKMTDEFFGLRLNEQYSQIDAIDILRSNTGKSFDVKEDIPLLLVGHNIDFAGYLWELVYFEFDYTNHLYQVSFEKYFYSFGERVDSPSFKQAETEANVCYDTLMNMLKGKYGKATTDNSHPEFYTGSMRWQFGKKQFLDIYLSSVNYNNLDKNGWIPQFGVIINYTDDRARSSASDML